MGVLRSRIGRDWEGFEDLHFSKGGMAESWERMGMHYFSIRPLCWRCDDQRFGRFMGIGNAIH